MESVNVSYLSKASNREHYVLFLIELHAFVGIAVFLLK